MLTATIFLMGLGLIASLILVVASKVFYVWEDPRIEEVSDALLGANCGGCGYAGCAAAAEAVVQNKAKPDVCVAGGFEIAQAVATVMGMTVEEKEPEISKPGCTYGFDKADLKYEYDGLYDCRAAMLLYDGSKVCDIGCLGLGTCVKACPFDALSMGENNLPVVDNEKCTGCGMCEEICPKDIITLSSATIRLMSDQKLSECTAPCQRHCPAEIDIPRYIREIRAGDYEGALRTIKEKNPFPLICGWICPAPCEEECRRNLLDEPVAINGLKKYVANLERESGEHKIPYLPPVSGKKISVIGGGVEGLTASYYLRRLGHDVTVIEATEKLGGILRYVITEDRLPREAIDWDINGILSTGIESRTGVMVGKDVTFETLIKDETEMVLITSGGWDSRHIMNNQKGSSGIIPDSDLLLDFLSAKGEKKTDLKKKRIVISGAGRAALKAVESCFEAQAAKVCCIFPFSKEEAIEKGLDISVKPNLEIVFSSEIAEISGKGNTLKKVIVRNEYGDTLEMDIDHLLIDSGRIPEMLFDLDKETDEWRSTEVLGVFSGGKNGGIFATRDIGRPTDLERVVVAVGSGRKLARGAHLFSNGEEPVPEENVITDEKDVLNIFRIPNRAALIDHRDKYDPSEIFSESTTKDQAQRCLSCGLICYQKSEKVCKLI